MLSPEVLQRISELNRQQAGAGGPLRIAAWRARAGRAPGASPAPAAAAVAAISRVPRQSTRELPEGREIETPFGKHLLLQRPLHELWDGAEAWLRRLPPLGPAEGGEEKSAASRSPLHPELQALLAALPDTAMFLDLETCGFAGSMTFLAGLLVAGPEGMTLLQLLARHYGEEQAMLHTLWQVSSQQTVLATFNGKSFDWPTVLDRTTMHRIQRQGPLSVDPAPHCDLLHACRRRWRRQLPNCRLQTLERAVCGRRRRGDIPGRDIPDAYHQFVRSGDAWQMRDVLHHNALDLLTLLQLSLVLLCESRGEDEAAKSA